MKTEETIGLTFRCADCSNRTGYRNARQRGDQVVCLNCFNTPAKKATPARANEAAR